ncbi:MAG: PpiC-type peptidyl-prolyl cis-trans isomerase [Bacteroidetes bacterium OLB11]|nr:MAG: PpiC-type peptidyl-prolyl cis-trans isomerase [Bacteroidetes bacterium OLB11]
MSFIQTIRTKYIGIVIGALVVALIGFLVMDAMQSNVVNIFRGDQTKLADINGKRLGYKEFDDLRNKYEDNLKARNEDNSISEEQRNQAFEQAWNDILNDIIIDQEYEKLGLSFTDKELQDMLTGTYADPMVKQSFSDPNTGIFDPSKVNEYIKSLSQDKTGTERKKWKEFEDAIIQARKIEKYNNLIEKGIYVPTFVAKRIAKESVENASIDYVQVPYSSINDNEVKVSDDEITNYMKKRERIFKATEDLVKIEYVQFNIIPSSADSALSLGVLDTLKNTFISSTNNDDMVANYSEESMKDIYYNTKTLNTPNPLEIISAGVGTVIGPIYNNGSYELIKVIDKKTLPDSVKVSHILIAFTDQRNENEAKASCDSIEQALKSGMDFGQLAAQKSDDQNSANKGGDLGYIPQGAISKEFSDACFFGKVGDTKVVKTNYGWHIIKITEQKDFQPSVKLAVISKALQAGQETIQQAYNKAQEFANQTKDTKTFDETIKKIGKDKRIAERITNSQSLIPGLGNVRELIRWAHEAKVGAVSQVFNFENQCIVANLVSKQIKGTMPEVSSIRQQLENIIKKEKKTQLISEKYKGKSLEEIAAQTQTTVVSADSITYLQGNPQLAYDPKVVGASFNKDLLNKVSQGIEGDQATYFIKVKKHQRCC